MSATNGCGRYWQVPTIPQKPWRRQMLRKRPRRGVTSVSLQASRASSAACQKRERKRSSTVLYSLSLFLSLHRHLREFTWVRKLDMFFSNIFELRIRAAAPESETSPNHHGPCDTKRLTMVAIDFEKTPTTSLLTECLVGIFGSNAVFRAPTFWESATVCDSMMFFRGDAVHGRDWQALKD